MADKTVGGMILRRIQESPSSTALQVKRGGGWVKISWRELGARMENIAAGLLTAVEGLEDGAHIAILGNTSEDWVAIDFACLSVGLRTVPVYATLLDEETGYLHVDTGSVISIVEDAAQLAKVRAMREGFTFYDKTYGPADVLVQRVVVMNPAGIEPADDWESLAALEARGAANLAATKEDRARRAAQHDRQDTCTYTYTSGTTGPPKGVIQSHENMLSMIEGIDRTGMFDPDVAAGGLFLFLPLAHSFGRLIELAGPFFDAKIIVSGIPTLIADLGETLPGFFPAAPRVFEKMKSKIEMAVAGAPPLRQKIFHWALDAGRATIPYRSTGRPVPMGIRLKNKIADRLVHSKLRDKLGMTNAKILLSGSAPLNVQVHEFFLAMGLDLLEAYGLTETCPGLTSNLPGAFKLGTVGKAFPGVTIKIAADGEILAKGPNITKGYLNRPESTAEAFDAEEWFCTGDLGSMDSDGFVKITGRKKELMKTSGGKYVAPAKLEGRLKNLPIIQEAISIADTRNYVTALIAIDPEELAEWATLTGNANDPQGDAVIQAVQGHVDEVNTTLASYESVKYFRIIEPLTVEGGLLTASLKVKRKVVMARYADLIEDIYTSAARPPS